MSIYGPGPDVLFRYAKEKKAAHEAFGTIFYIGSIAFVTIIVMVITIALTFL
jgi:hypothetical protein